MQNERTVYNCKDCLPNSACINFSPVPHAGLYLSLLLHLFQNYGNILVTFSKNITYEKQEK